MNVSTQPVWAEKRFGRNKVRQLLVPGGTLQVSDEAGALGVSNVYGRWPAVRTAAEAIDGLTAVLPSRSGREVRWQGGQACAPQTVVESYREAIGFRPYNEPRSLRRPQIGALHAVMGHWASGLSDPGLVVMPTGTGKTETMLALLVAARMERLLVLVPSAALRDQIAGKFETLGILQKDQIVTSAALRPRVGRLEHGFKDPEEAARFVESCNVVVATPQILNRSVGNVRTALLSSFSHLIVDEAHHSPADTWARVIDDFADRPVLLFTATPFREDGRRLPGRTVFRFPLREAQRLEYFKHINYRAVFGVEDVDRELAELAVGQLRADLAAGHDHLLMARAESIPKAEELGTLYQELASEFQPTVVHQNVGVTRRKAAVQALRERSCRVIICVDMLGEGFDEPALKIAAMHAARKSLSPMIQFIGRFTRATDGLGEATVFVAQEPHASASPLRRLLREDADWNDLLRDLTDRATLAAEETSAFDSTFSGAPEEVAVSVLEPKMSAIAYRASTAEWRPEAALTLCKANEQVLDDTVALGGEDSPVAWYVVERRTPVRWGAPQELEQVVYELMVLYFDIARRLLYIHGSEKSSNYKELAEAVLGEDCELINGKQTFRVLARLDRLVPTNVGLKDARDYFTRFSLHVGSDVSQGFTTAQEHKSQTHIAASGYDNGDSVSISAAHSGRFWSHTPAPSLKAWTDWCDYQGTKLLDSTINLEQVFDGFIIPEDIAERPGYALLAVQWPWHVYLGSRDRHTLTYDTRSYPLTDVDFEVDDCSPTGPFLFSLTTPAWRVAYEADYDTKGLIYRPRERDAVVIGSGPAAQPQPLEEWLNAHKPDLFLEGDRLIDDEGKLIAPRYTRRPYDPSLLTPLDWKGVDFRKESQKSERLTDSIQYYMSAYLQATRSFGVLIDDDGNGEAADLVGLQVNGGYLDVTLVHCKYSKATPGKRLKDLYEVCGQAMRGAKWRRGDAVPLLDHLHHRAVLYTRRNGGISPYDVGGPRDLFAIREHARLLRPRFHTIIAQPGLQARKATDEQLLLLAGAEKFVCDISAGDFTVYCSR
ncbi:DEAD/DEAH box helicase [Streptomyces europaeiscabiei]|uniref:DEAD/DEAH box helicase n=1 Tax=Streptomyces europaeiscabiei TaxID=146819 RepID=UPI0029B9586A|nr:DEAD/DEAH box helicase family protein [Streptomyces europaeiscabiei]MDX3866893.1 DEAD/DEAH box helicase family protein [Streptomyces europaeiscabiei]MDX3873079.1 DEAD/DEAH box helicase family protein [Streptomyces europaeiscabiei]